MNSVFKKLSLAAILIAGTVGLAEAKVLRFGTEATFAPFEFMDENAKPIGYDIDIIEAIGKAEGFDVEIVNMGFDGLIPAMLSSQIDGAIAGISITPERAKKVAFSDPYYNSGLSAMIRKEDADKYKTIESLSKSRICSQIGTTGAKAAQKISGNVGAFNTVPDAFIELKSKGCEAVLNDRPVNLYFLTKTKDHSVVEIPELLEGEQYGIAVAKNNQELVKSLNDGLKKIREDGTFAKIHEKWFGVSK